MDLQPNDRTCLETVHSDGLISEDLGHRTSTACTPACNHPTRNNESLDLLVPSRARLHTFFDFKFASLYRSLYAVTIRPKALYEGVHAPTGHPGYAGMQWHQKNTTGPRGICLGCALGSAHQYPTNQHNVMSDTTHDPGQQFVVDAFTHHSVRHSSYVYAHLFTDLASRQEYPVFTKSKLVSELTTNMSELFCGHPDWKPNGSVIDRISISRISRIPLYIRIPH